MRIVIDIQSLQTDSRFRGIGRYTSSFVRALLRNKGGHDVILVTSGILPNVSNDFLEEIQKGGVRCQILEWYAPLPVAFNNEKNREVAELLRENFIRQQKPDIVVVTSLFEGYGDNAICSVKRLQTSYPVAVILYDLIPLANPSEYLDFHPEYKKYYLKRVDYICQADLCLSISSHSKLEAHSMLPIESDKIINISAAIEDDFSNSMLEQYAPDELLKQLKITKRFVLYVGGSDARKNLDRLIAAFALLPEEIRLNHQLVFAGGMSEKHVADFFTTCTAHGVHAGDLIVAGYLKNIELVALYKRCALFVFPSIHEGFGLPALEAMACGAPVIGSNITSLPEVIDLQDALFDPFDVQDISAKMRKGLTDPTFRSLLRANGARRVPMFSWDEAARRAIRGFESQKRNVENKDPEAFHPELFNNLAPYLALAEEKYLISLANCLAANESNEKSLLDEFEKLNKRPGSATETALNVFHSLVPKFDNFDRPMVFSSTLCRQQHFHLPLYSYWCKALAEKPRLHRKQWEFVYICQVLNERGYLRDGATAVGFGVGREPLVSYFASRGVDVLATDLDFEEAHKLGWVSTEQHSSSLHGLNERGICEKQAFSRLAKYREVDMNCIPLDIGRFDFCWSSCAFEHLGSIRKGLDFVINSARLLAPGGLAVHTTEYNINSNIETLDNNPSFVIFRRRDIEQLVDELRLEGFAVEPIDFTAGVDELEQFVDLPPYMNEPHLRLQLAGEYISTSIGIIVRAPSL